MITRYARTILLIIIVWIIFMIKHYPKRKLTKNLKELISRKGLIHFTLWENAEKIQNEGLYPRKEKAMFFLEKNMVWLYVNNEKDFELKYDIIHKKGRRKEYNTVVYFTHICESELQKMRYRKSDVAIVHIGQLKPKTIII